MWLVMKNIDIEKRKEVQTISTNSLFYLGNQIYKMKTYLKILLTLVFPIILLWFIIVDIFFWIKYKYCWFAKKVFEDIKPRY
jgi:hypothetical protein